MPIGANSEPRFARFLLQSARIEEQIGIAMGRPQSTLTLHTCILHKSDRRHTPEDLDVAQKECHLPN